MTNEELIFKLRQLHDFYDVYIGDLSWIYEVIEKIKKQMPEEVIEKTSEDGNPYYECPKCNAYICSYFKDDREKYCSNCGQSLG